MPNLDEMMNIFTVSFFGHRQFDGAIAVEQKLEQCVRELLRTKEYVEFLVGRDGAFDLLAASTIHRCRQAVRTDNSALIWVMPYPSAAYQKNMAAFDAYYDAVEICGGEGHFKAAFQARNRAMVDRSDLVVFYVERERGGAYQTLRYAEKTEKSIINLAKKSRR